MKIELFGQIFKKKALVSNFIKIRPVGAELFHADRRTDRHDEAKYSPFAILLARLKTEVLEMNLFRCQFFL